MMMGERGAGGKREREVDLMLAVSDEREKAAHNKCWRRWRYTSPSK
jgi:hypothetical protein